MRPFTEAERQGLIASLVEISLGIDLLNLRSVGSRFGLDFDEEELSVLETY